MVSPSLLHFTPYPLENINSIEDAVAALAGVYRTGWHQRGVHLERCETVLQHVTGMRLLAREHLNGLGAEEVDALVRVHDVPEIRVGDISLYDGRRKSKKELEAQAMDEIADRLPDGERWLGLWLDYERRRTPAGVFVRAVDKCQLGLRAIGYLCEGYSVQEFFPGVYGHLENSVHPPLRDRFIEEMHAALGPDETSRLIAK